MAASNICIRFTDEKYATKAELSSALGMSSIDSFWNQIIQYRNQYKSQLNIKNIYSIPFFVTYTPTINETLNKTLSNLSNLNSKISVLNDQVTHVLRKEGMLNAIRSMSVSEGKKINELSLRAMINGTYYESNPDHESTLNYARALKEFFDNPTDILNEDFLAKYYALLLNVEELSTFYRSNNQENSYKFKTTILSKNYDYVESDRIDHLMDSFFNFVNETEGDPIVKAVTAFYYFDYVKPFDYYNKELGCLAAKAVLANSKYEKAAPFINFEDVFRDADKYAKLFLETSKTSDLTYLVLSTIPVIEKSIDETLNFLIQKEVSIIHNEQYADIKKVEPVEDNIVAETTSYSESEQVKETENTEEKVEEVSAPAEPEVEVKEELVVPKIPEPTLSPQEIKEFAKYILETNPSIRKPQAVFFANHCTVGHYYSIQDYKNATKCVYETARTSMDNLAKEGFYKKVQIKNKFVYTPIKHGGQ